MEFEWSDLKNTENIRKHKISFYEAQEVFLDENRIILYDTKHSTVEDRYFCIGKTTKGVIVTVRFTKRNGSNRIIGAGYWRKGRKLYEKNN